MRDNTTTLTAWGGIKDDRTLQWLSDICGTYERTRRQSHADGLFSRERHSYSTETVPVMRPGQIRELPSGQVLAIHRGVRCFVAHAVDVTQRPDSTQIDADVATLRDGTAIPIDDRGYRTGSPHSERRT